MPPLPSKVSDDYARRTPCNKHMQEYNGIARGSMRHDTWSNCEYRGHGCRYSHTIFNTQRILKLGEGVVCLNYGHGFERYGAYEMDRSGWDISLDDITLCSGGQKTSNLPKSILLAELKKGNTWKDAPPVSYEKKQSLCMSYQSGACPRGSECRFDHDLIDAERLEALAGRRYDGFDTFNFMTVECRVSGHRGHWKITLKPDVLKAMKPNDPMARTMPSLPFSKEGDDLLQVIREMETAVGIASQLN